MKLKKLVGIGAVLLAAMAVSGYWYVFVNGAEQFDGPGTAAAAEKTNLNYKLVSYNSQVMGTTRTYGVVLPPGYRQHPHQHYPVVFLLHGGHGNPTDWFKKGAALPVIQRLFENHRLPLSIIITPDGNDMRGSSPLWDPAYVDGKDGRVLSAIGDELVQVIRKTYRTKPQSQFWAIGGLSSGGWGALNVGLHFSQHFSVLFSHSGYFTDKTGPDNSPMTYVSTIDPAMRHNLQIYLDAGEGDGKYLTQSREFHDELTQLGVANVFNEFPGGHGIYGADVGWNYWHHHLADSLSFVGTRFKDADLSERASHRFNASSTKSIQTQSEKEKSPQKPSTQPVTKAIQNWGC